MTPATTTCTNEVASPRPIDRTREKAFGERLRSRDPEALAFASDTSP